jgi:hypothetical protein
MSGIKRPVQGFLDGAGESPWIVIGNTKGITGQLVGGRPVCGKADQPIRVFFDLDGGVWTEVVDDLAAQGRR